MMARALARDLVTERKKRLKTFSHVDAIYATQLERHLGSQILLELKQRVSVFLER